MSTLLFTGRTDNCSFENTDVRHGMQWLRSLKTIGLDTETNVVDTILNRKLKVIAIADEPGNYVWVIEYEYLFEHEQLALLYEISKKLCIIQNVSFDYSIIKKYGIRLEKVWDTMLAEQTITNGLGAEQGFHGLAAIIQRRFGVMMSKDEQTTFGQEEPYSTEQILYAGGDVVYLGAIRRQQVSEMRAEDARINQGGNRGLMKTMWWENEFVKCVADMEMEGVRIDRNKWYAIEDEVRPIFEQEQLELNSLVLQDLKHVLIENNWVGLEDEVVTNVWSSTVKKKALIEHVYGQEIEKTAKAQLKKFLEEHDPNFPEELRGKLNTKAWSEHDYPYGGEDDWIIIKLMILLDKNTKEELTPVLNQCLIANYKEFIQAQGWFRAKDEVTINWGSPPQRLAIFQGIDPTIESTSKDILADFVDTHPIFPHYLKYAEVAHQIRSFGKSFYDKHVELDGKIRTRFRQILATGRLSSTNPSLLNMPNAQVYRNCFIADEGFEIFGADYAGEELVVTATLAGEQIWLDALAQGKDLHSINAHLIFGARWDEASEQECQFAVDQHQCKCPKHKELRGQSKAVSFGSIYGISAPKLAFNLKITVEEAAQILKNFFAGLPNIQKMMDKFGRFALVNGYILEPVFGRVRYFDKWKLNNPREHASVERASYNSPIQSSGSSVLKIAAVLMRRWIYQNNHQDNIKLQLPVHDEFMGQARPAYMTLAKEKLEYFMELAGKLAGFPLSADAASGVSWGEVH